MTQALDILSFLFAVLAALLWIRARRSKKQPWWAIAAMWTGCIISGVHFWLELGWGAEVMMKIILLVINGLVMTHLLLPRRR